MDFALTLPVRWMIVLGISVMLWVIPITVNAPALVILFCLSGAIGGFVYSAEIAGIWKEDDRRGSKLRLQREELENFTLALEEQATKAELMGQFIPLKNVQAEFTQEPERSTIADGLTQTQEPERPTVDGFPLGQEYYTNLNLAPEAAAALIVQLRRSMTKQQIIEQLWGCKKGGSQAYKTAAREYEALYEVGVSQ
jgi:hypothetical protein